MLLAVTCVLTSVEIRICVLFHSFPHHTLVKAARTPNRSQQQAAHPPTHALTHNAHLCLSFVARCLKEEEMMGNNNSNSRSHVHTPSPSTSPSLARNNDFLGQSDTMTIVDGENTYVVPKGPHSFKQVRVCATPRFFDTQASLELAHFYSL